MHRFFLPGPLAVNTQVKLSTEESHHAVKVLRLQAGEKVEILNGEGSWATSELVEAHTRSCLVQIGEVTQVAQQNQLSLVFAVPKAAALEFMIRRATEIGVASFQPILTQFSLHPDWNETRWQRILVEVAKQCQDPYFPKLLAPKKLEAYLRERDAARALIFCNEWDRKQASPQLMGKACDLMIGPEGGWAKDEIETILQAGAFSFGLGRNRLRAEMAAVVGAVLIKKEMGEFNLTK